MATSKTLTPTNVTIQIPEFTDQPDQRVNSNCIDKEADAINALNNQIANVVKTFQFVGTTSANGNVEVKKDNIAFGIVTGKIICINVVGEGSTIALPYLASNNVWYLHCIKDSSTYAVDSNKELTFDVYYY